jgi:hypothetical protein
LPMLVQSGTLSLEIWSRGLFARRRNMAAAMLL